MKSYELIKALEEGKALKLDFKYAYPERYKYSEYGEHVQIIKFYHDTARHIHRYGWGSALGKESEVLEDILRNPEMYQISEND